MTDDLKVAAVAALTGFSRQHLYQQIADGKLAARRDRVVEYRVVIPASEVQRLIERRQDVAD